MQITANYAYTLKRGFYRTTPTKDQQIAALQAGQRELSEQLGAQAAEFRESLSKLAEGQALALKMSEYLLPALAAEIGAEASVPQIVGRTKVATVGDVKVTIDGFARTALLCVNGNTPHDVEPVSLYFGTNGKLSRSQMRVLRGFLTEVAKPVQASEFWDGTEAAAA